MITIPHLLIALAAIVLVIVFWAAVMWAIQREPAGHGQHAARRTLHLEYEDLECFQPAVATLHNPYALDDIHASRHRDWTPRPISAARDLAPWVAIALANAKPDETVIDHRLGDDTRDAWQTGTADDPFEGYGDAEGWVRALFAGKVQVAA